MADIAVVNDVSLSDADEILEHTWEQAKKVMVQTNSQSPMFFVYLENSVVLYGVGEEFQTPAGKKKMSLLMHEYANRPQTQAIAFVGEAHAVEGNNTKEDLDLCREKGVAAHPRSKEILYVSVETRAEMVMRQAAILRDAAGALTEIAEPKTVRGAMNIGVLAGFFPKGQA